MLPPLYLLRNTNQSTKWIIKFFETNCAGSRKFLEYVDCFSFLVSLDLDGVNCMRLYFCH